MISPGVELLSLASEILRSSFGQPDGPVIVTIRDQAGHRLSISSPGKRFRPTAEDEGLPEPETPMEQDILEALGEKTLRGEEICRLSGYTWGGTFRGRLARMSSAGLLEKTGSGYRVNPRPGQRAEERRLPETLEPETPMEQDIIEAIGSDTLRGEQICARSGYSWGGRFRTRLARMVSAGLLQKTIDGYRRGPAYVQPHKEPCCSPAEDQPCVECTPNNTGPKSILDWEPPTRSDASGG